MRYYEILFIVHPNYEQDRLNTVIKMVETHIADIGGNVLAVDDWGKRRLAYPIEKQKFGNYVLIYFEAEPSVVIELQHWFELQAQILAQLIVRLNEKPDGLPARPSDDNEEEEETLLIDNSSDFDDESDEIFDEEEDEEEDNESLEEENNEITEDVEKEIV
ncbi:MAG: 30S ribosomal protein S6 [Candidatus Marinimicrobia bacterium]|nr:30S ribosomal protein S6 [Candidatus Neomarinimicrobiota bacterium]MDD5583003.1 30S ribosomal protein S6 [Candidatus Neomarinimicrobiota bacterium]